MKIVFSPKCLEYGPENSFENPNRVRLAFEFLKKKGYKFVEPEQASEKSILKVHSENYVNKFRTGKFEGDRETPAFPKIYEYAKLSAGGAIMAAKIKGFSLMRPPGHHAGKNGIAMGASTLGFCYLNSIAIAVRSLGVKAAIIDIDIHHGNGTQDIFFGDKRVMFISLHKKIWPFTGRSSEGNCHNFTFYDKPGDKKYLETLDLALNEINTNVKIIGISAGFDTYENDPIASLGLSLNCYLEIGKKIKGLGIPVFAVLEGGYSKYLGPAIDKLIQGLES